MVTPSSNRFASAALVLGFVGVPLASSFPLFGALTYILTVPCGILALIFGIVGRRRSGRAGDPNRGNATVGMVLGVIVLVLAIASLVYVVQSSSVEVSRTLSAVA